MDVIRDKLLFDNEGIPLGALVGKLRFADISYLISPEFIFGFRGFKSRRKRWFFRILIVICSSIALLAGPSAALLTLPSYFTYWPAGGGTFWVNGNLSPTRLDNSTIQNPNCMRYTSDPGVLTSKDWRWGSCPWAGYPFLANYFDQPTLQTLTQFSYNYGTFVHQFNLYWSWINFDLWDMVRFWTVGSNTAVAAFTHTITQYDYCQALYFAKEVQPGHAYHNLLYRVRNGTKASVRNPLPVVRSQCFMSRESLSSVPTDLPVSSDEVLMPVSSLCLGILVLMLNSLNTVSNVSWRRRLGVPSSKLFHSGSENERHPNQHAMDSNSRRTISYQLRSSKCDIPERVLADSKTQVYLFEL